jgi:hypothetical protein
MIKKITDAKKNVGVIQEVLNLSVDALGTEQKHMLDDFDDFGYLVSEVVLKAWVAFTGGGDTFEGSMSCRLQPHQQPETGPLSTNDNTILPSQQQQQLNSHKNVVQFCFSFSF